MEAETQLPERLRCGITKTDVESFIRGTEGAPYYYILARERGNLVGYAGIYVYTASMVYLESWQPLILPEYSSESLFLQILKECIEQVRRIGRNRLEVFLMNLTEDVMGTYELYKPLYEAAGMKRGHEWTSMTCDLSRSKLKEPEFPDDFHLRPLSEISNEELWPCYNASFMTSEDGRYLNQTEEQRRENFEDFFDRKKPMVDDASIVLMNREEIVGFMKINIYSDSGFVNGVGIHPDYRRRGLGRAMMKASLVRAKQSDMQSVTLEVDVENKGAIELYKQVDFISTHGSISHVWKE